MSFRFGVDNLDTSKDYGKVGLVTNATGITSGMFQNVDHLQRKGMNLVRIFSPEHGFYSTFGPGEDVPDEVYNGIPVKSLYNGDSKEVDKSGLEDLDTVIFDLQDAGVRFYTYLSTLHNLLISSKGLKTRVVILDRPNPIRSDIVEGPLLDIRHRSFVGTDAIPIRYGMTIGELARFMDRNCGVDPEVVKMSGYSRKAYYDELVPFYVPFSWNLPNLDSVINYSGLCIFEAAPVSIGRGTPYPFSLIGYESAWNEMKNEFPGIFLRRIQFTSLVDPLRGMRLPGYYIHITDRKKYSPLEVWLSNFYRLYCSEKSDFREEWVTYLYGSRRLNDARSRQLSFENLLMDWEQDVKSFMETRSDFLLY